MKKYLLVIAVFCTALFAHAQFGFVKKPEIERIKDTRVVVVLNADSSYNASIQAAMQKYWTFNSGYVFVSDTMLKPFMKKPEYSFLVFSKSKGSRLKVKVCSAESDINGLLLAKSFKRKVPSDDMVAIGYCSNTIDTADWWPEMVRGVQMLNGYLNIAIEGKDDRAISESFLMSNYPTDKAVMTSQTLLYEKKLLDIKASEDVPTLWDGEADELVDRDAIYQAILHQDQTRCYYMQVQDEKYCNKMVISANGSELMYFNSTGRDNCKLTAKDLKNLKTIKMKAQKL
jgi:hypothetical protein